LLKSFRNAFRYIAPVDCRGQWGFVFIALEIRVLPIVKFALSAGGASFGSFEQITVLHGNIHQLA